MLLLDTDPQEASPTPIPPTVFTALSMDYSLHDSRVLEVPSRAAQAAKVLRVLEHFSYSAGLSLARSSCLDVGCSSGIITRALAPHFRRVVGVDVDAHALALARSVDVDAQTLARARSAGA